MAVVVDAGDRQNPRTRRVQRVVLESAIEVLLTEGAAAVNPSRVAAHADVARTTIYRHWPDQASLLLATVDAMTIPDHAFETSGDLSEDLQTTAFGLRTRIVSRQVRTVFGAFAAHSAADEGFARAQRRFVDQLADPIRRAIDAARERGDVAGTVDAAVEASSVAGPILFLHLVALQEIPDSVVEDVVVRSVARIAAD